MKLVPVISCSKFQHSLPATAMKIDIKKEDLNNVLLTIFKLDEKIFIEKYHLRSKTTQQLADYLQDDIIYMAYLNKTPIGYITYEQKNGSAEITGLAILPEYQNKGIGTILMDKIFNILGKRTIFLVVHPSNSQAVRLYLKLGFKIVGWKDNYYGDCQPRLVLKRIN